MTGRSLAQLSHATKFTVWFKKVTVTLVQLQKSSRSDSDATMSCVLKNGTLQNRVWILNIDGVKRWHLWDFKSSPNSTLSALSLCISHRRRQDIGLYLKTINIYTTLLNLSLIHI